MYTIRIICLVVIVNFISLLESKPYSVTMPDSCRDKSYCFEKSPDYPQNELEAIFSDLHMKAINEPVEIGDRAGNEQVCPYNKTLKPIYEIIDEAGDVRFVAQLEDKFIQNYTITECVRPGRIMKEDGVFTRTLLDNFNVMCVDTLISPKFLVLTHDKKNVEVVSAQGGVPMGCACRYDFI